MLAARAFQSNSASAAQRRSVATDDATRHGASRHENGSDAYGDTLLKLQRACEDAGIQLIDENGGRPGVRLKNRMTSPGSGSSGTVA